MRKFIEKKGNPLKTIIILLLAITAMLAVGCGSDSADVASLKQIEDKTEANNTVDTTDTYSDEEEAMMAFVQCMREQGIEYEDPVVDSDGNVQKPVLVEGFTVGKKEIAAAWEVCGEFLEGISFGKEREDVSETVDQLIALAECLNSKGFEVDEPTTETLDDWYIEFKEQFDWDNPAAQAAYEECSGTVIGRNSKTSGGKK